MSDFWGAYWLARGVTLHFMPRHDPLLGYLRFEQLATRVADLLEVLDPDIVHFTDCDGLGAIATLRRAQQQSLQGTRFVTTTHGSVRWYSVGNEQPMDAEAHILAAAARVNNFAIAMSSSTPVTTCEAGLLTTWRWSHRPNECSPTVSRDSSALSVRRTASAARSTRLCSLVGLCR